jgi:hypothetical protein
MVSSVPSRSLPRGVFAGGVLLLVFWALAIASVIRARGLFDWIGFDFGVYWAAARAFFIDGPVSVYDLEVLRKHIAPVGAFYGSGADPLKVGPVPYPPIFFLLIAPFAALPPLVAFLTWTALNVVAAVAVLRGMAERAGWSNGWGFALLGLSFAPIVFAIWVGQPTVLMTFALYRAYRSFEREDDFKAGLWAGALLLKPQYAAFLGIALLLNRRWRAAAGMALVGGLAGASAVAVLGRTSAPTASSRASGSLTPACSRTT